MSSKLEDMIKRNKTIKKVKFNKELKKESQQKGEDYLKLKKQNEEDINQIVSDFTRDLKEEIKNVDSDIRIKISQWISCWIYYISYENQFNPQKLMTYKRGDIVHINFGFNVHNELGGTHYAVVVENDNPASNGTVTVVPLKSAASKEDALNNIHIKTEVYLGTGIICTGKGKDKHTIAKVNQMRAIDKMRILKPRNSKNDIVYPIDSEVRKLILDKIDSKIIELYTKKNKVDN